MSLNKNIRREPFMKAPDFWVSGWEEVNRFLEDLKLGDVWEFGFSQGRHPIRAVAYGGPREPIERRSQINTAALAGHPEDFFDPEKRSRPVVLIISTIHGIEVEGCVSCLNLAQILETGVDQRGRRWEALRDLAEKMRIVLVPIAQPDGRIRSAVRHMVGATLEELTYYGQGEPRDPSVEASWDWFLRNTPVSPEKVSFLGGYFNDAGVNIDLDDFLSPCMAPETDALLQLAREETPDCVIVLHSHNPGPWVAAPNSYISQRCQLHQAQFRSLVSERHRREGLRPAAPPVTRLTSGYFNLPAALYHVCGALPLAFEFPHGTQKTPYTFDEILDIGLTLFEELFRYVYLNRYLPGQPTRNRNTGLREI